jgi:DtxR family transcriptional regulator, manganese transport regulator
MASTRRDSLRKAHAHASPKYRSESLAKTRRDHANETAEDYVEAIADLIAETGEARVVD